MAQALPINYSDPQVYENLSLIVSEFEKAALRSASRQGIAATAHSPLNAMDMILQSSETALNMNRTGNAPRASNDASRTTTSDTGGTSTVPPPDDGDIAAPAQDEARFGIDAGPDPDAQGPSFQIGTTGSIGFDADINELFGGEGDPNRVGDTLGDWLADCIGCDLRLSFSWQLQPIDLLGPVADLISQFNIMLDQFEGFLDPFGLLEDLCDLLNGVNFLCIPDLITILMSLKMLLKSYLTSQLQIRLDWTMLVGPLLKLILDAIATLIQQIAGVVLAPLDCASAALMTVAKLQNELQQTANLAVAVGERVADRTAGVAWSEALDQNSFDELDDNEFRAEARFKDVEIGYTVDAEAQAEFDVQSQLAELGIPGYEQTGDAPRRSPVNVQTNQRRGDQNQASGAQASFFTGFEITSTTTLPDALRNPNFLRSGPFVKMALVVQEARNYIMGLVRRILTVVRNLEGLVSGSLTLNLGNLGLLLFLKDMINLVLLIIQLLSRNNDVDDWCAFLEENPQALEELLNGVQVEPDTERLRLRRGPKVVGEIKTCFNERSDSQSALLKQWIADLKRDGSS